LKIYYDNHLKKVEEDRRLREEEMRLQNINFREKIDELTRKNHKLESLTLDMTKDILQMKFDSQNNERKLYEEVEMYKLQNEALSLSLSQLNTKICVDKEKNKSEYDKKTNEIANVFRGQVKNHEENINIIKEQYKQIQKIYNSRIEDYEVKVKKLTEKYKSLDFKRNNEIEGFINENNLIRKRMKSYEDYVHRLKQITNGGLDIKKLNDINREIEGSQEKFFTGTKHFKKSLDSFKNKLVRSNKGNNDDEEEYEANDQRSMNEEINNHSYNRDFEGAEMEMI